MRRVRLRQAVLAAADLDAAQAALRDALGLGEPFHDPGVALFGLRNAVFALGDCFLEVVSPTQPDTAAGRYMQRRGGDTGYMVIFDLEDLDGARTRAREAGMRVAWQVDLPDISATHLHPADTGAAIVSLDQSRPYGTWRWGGPNWTGRIGSGAPGRLLGVTLAVGDPGALAGRWGELLGVPVGGDERPLLKLDGGEVRFEMAGDPRREGLVEIAVGIPAELRERHGGAAVEVGGVRLRLHDFDP
jgi:hypothetical protein